MNTILYMALEISKQMLTLFFVQLAGRLYPAMRLLRTGQNQAAEEGLAITGKNEGGQWHAIEKLSASLSAGLSFGLETYLPKERLLPGQLLRTVEDHGDEGPDMKLAAAFVGAAGLRVRFEKDFSHRYDNCHINAVTHGGYSDILAKGTFLSRVGRMPWVRNFVVPIVKGSVLDFSVPVGVSLIGTQKWICASTEICSTFLKDWNYLITKP